MDKKDIKIEFKSKEKIEANMELMQEAFKVANETGLSPTQMRDRIVELENAIKKYIETFDVESYSKDSLLLENTLNNKQK